MLVPATPSSPGASVHALVLGRIQVSVGGRPVRVGAGVGGAGASVSPSSWSQGTSRSVADSLTMLVFRDLRSGEEFGFEIPDETGRFELLLPPGEYTIRLRYEEWLSETPVTFEAPEAGAQYYIGTLHADLFRGRSLRGWWARVFGGNVPATDSHFAVIDDWQWARAHLRAFEAPQPRVQKQLMTLQGSP
jgi:hypothetical protein